MALNLVTLAEYKAYAELNSTNNDSVINILIPNVSQLVKNYCRRTFVDYVDTPKIEIFRGGVPYIMLEENPIITITSLELSIDYGQTYTPLVEFTDWVLDGNQIFPLTSTEFPKYLRGYKVTYTGGFDDVPDDIKLAVMDLITYYRKNEASVKALKHVNTNSMQIEYLSDAALPSHIKRILDMYISDYV